MIPHISRAMVYSHDTRLWGVRVMLLSGQIPPFTFQVVRPGYSDGYRIKQTPLPVIGTWGVVALVNGDSRAGYWIGSVDTNYITAVQDIGDSSVDFYSHISGYVSYLDKTGTHYTQFSDGTYVLNSSSVTPPSLTRNVVNADQSVSVATLNLSDRIQTVPSPRYCTLSHATGTEIQINPSGGVSVDVASGGTLTGTCGGTSLEIDSSGNTTVTGASGSEMTLSFNGATIQITSTGIVNIQTAEPVNVAGSVINLEAPVTLGSSSGGSATCQGALKMTAPSLDLSSGGSTQAVLLDAFYTWFVNTYMPSVTYVSGSPGPPPSNSVSTVLFAE